MRIKSKGRAAAYFAAIIVIAVGAYWVLWSQPGQAGAIRHLGPGEAVAELQSDPQAILVDVRTPAEFQSGHLRGALNLELDRLEAQAAQALPDKNANLVVYCRSGNRSAFAVQILERMGYTHLVNVTGGIAAWSAQGLPVVQD